MPKRPDVLRRFAIDDAGTTALEYGLLVALIAVVTVVAINGLEGPMQALYQTIKTALLG